ncbi:hypothetical protein CEXT_639361 [Caerostris extrusa]|uniref:Uncharacterized protein n=1 Tax=Caerostris extrusa TaxID=172846 RepID=A0AAV4WZY8_CAEEX|nr:hypothetical protein CEXT_639361 [Caerostris extrusa]
MLVGRPRPEASLGLKTPSNTSLSIKTSRLLRRRHTGEEASERRKEKEITSWAIEDSRLSNLLVRRKCACSAILRTPFVLHAVHFASRTF